MLFRPRDITIIPPQLPAYLSTYDLERIVGKPTDDQVKAIHAAIRALNSVAHLPALYDPDLSMQLSQHLFNAQLRIAVHREECMVALLPSDESTFIPPDLPPHIPGTLHKVIGAPSYDDVKSVQSAIRDVENLAYNSHLFDADLSMKLYQHLFNIQFARYMRDSVHGSFTSRIDSEERHPGVTSQSNNDSQQNNMNTRSEDRHHVTTRSSGPEQVKSSEITQLGDVMKEIKDAIEVHEHGHGGSLAESTSLRLIVSLEHNLPQLRFYFYKGGYHVSLSSEEITGYLKFLGIGSDLLEHNEKPELKPNKEDEAKRLLMNHIRIAHSNA